MADPAVRGTAEPAPGRPDPATRILSYCEAVIEAEFQRGFAAGLAAARAEIREQRTHLRAVGEPGGADG